MTQTLQLEPRIIRKHRDGPKLLIEWSPRWEGFVSNIGPAFARSAPRLAGEAPLGGFERRSMGASFVLQAIFVVGLLFLPAEIARMRPYAAPPISPDEVIYYSPDELPRTQDLSGAQSGATGRAGGREAHHPTQTIHVARGSSLNPRVVDAPNLKLPSSSDAVANLLEFKNVIPPPPTEGLHSSHAGPRLETRVIAPADTNISRDQSRSMTLNSAVIPPAPNVSRSRTRTSPSLNEAIVAPAPTVQSEHLYAPRLDPSIIRPAPSVASNDNRTAPSLGASIIAPASTRVSRDQSRLAPSLNGRIIAPAPSDVTHAVSPSRVQMNNEAVVPPPVSAPERENARVAKLNMPSPSVVAPPPSASSDNDLRRLESGGIPSSAPKVVPPPPTTAANGSFVSTIIGKIFGTQEVVPPPPNVSSSAAAGNSRTSPNGGQGTSLNANVIPPPPSVGGASSGVGNGQSGSQRGSSLGTSNVIPPPPSVAGAGRGSGAQGSAGSANGTLLASNVVPPPPSVESGSGASGYGHRGSGLGGPGDVGSVLAPPKNTRAGETSAVVVSTQPGSHPGLGEGGKGSLALSPTGGDRAGLGGNGGGTGIGNGTGPGSGMVGEDSGAGRSGAGRGSDPNAHDGISPTPGPGGAGTSPIGTPPVAGVDVRGGSTSNIVNLPSFSDGTSNAPALPGRSNIQDDKGPAITIVATSRSGGAFDFYGKLPGDNYTVYVDTNIGTVVMQFAEADPNAHANAGALVGPSGIRTLLPQNLAHARVVIKCKLDATGNLKNFQVLEAGPATMMAKIMAALPSWKFRPAQRGPQPVELNAILGFNINTNDRY